MKKRNKGITLVALIITIIIMFILIGVSINLVIHTDLFGSAKRAKDKTEQAYKDESNFGGSFNVDGVPQNSIENYVQATCDHTWSEWEITKEPTCTEEGSKRRECPRCEKVEVESIDKLGHDWDSSTGTCKECGAECPHDWGEWQTITEATCTVAGIKKRTCNICKKNEMGVIPMLGHNYSNGSCTRCNAPCPHDWEEWVVEIPETCTTEGTKSKTCKICGQKETESIPAKGHNWDSATGKCKDCEIECTHNWSEWKTTKEPTCTVEGTKQRTCSICNKVETGSVPVIGHNWNSSTGTCTNCGTACSHNWGEWQTTTAATCTIAGSKRKVCSICNKNEVESIPMLGHNWNASTGKCDRCGTACTHSWSGWTTTTAATCTAAGSKSRTCSVCKHVETESILATGHSWNASTGKCNTCGTACTHSWSGWTTTTAATCTAAGSKSRTCSVCKHVETDSIAATGHNWNASTGTCSTCGTSCSHSYGSYTTTKSATCTASGSKYRTCNTCGYKQTTSISKLGHSMGGWYTYKAATCTSSGRKDNDCQRSGCSYYETQTINALGHLYGSWTTTAATCTTAGSKKRTCTRSGCSSSETETIAALGHSYGSWTTTKAATCTASGSRKRTCTRSGCSSSETETIAALGHNYSNGSCTRCGASCSHTYGSWTTSTAATCTVTGSKYRTCSKCKYKDVQSIPKLEHNYSSSTGKCTRCGATCSHSWGAWKQSGLKPPATRTCGYCGFEEKCYHTDSRKHTSSNILYFCLDCGCDWEKDY